MEIIKRLSIAIHWVSFGVGSAVGVIYLFSAFWFAFDPLATVSAAGAAVGAPIAFAFINSLGWMTRYIAIGKSSFWPWKS